MKEQQESGAAPSPPAKWSPVKSRIAGWKNIVVSIYLQGNSTAETARLAEERTGHRFGEETVRKYIKDALNGFRETKDQMIGDHKAIELEKINRLEAHAWMAWERSCLVVKSKSKTKKNGAPANSKAKLVVSEVKEDEKPSAGDSRFMQVIEWCIEQRCKLLGVEVPALLVQNNTTNVQNNTLTVNRRIVFKTRETMASQIVAQP